MNLDAGHIVPQVEISGRAQRKSRAPASTIFARAEDAQFDARLAFREIGQAAGINQRAVNTGGAVISSSVSWARSRIVSTAAASDSKPSRSFGRQARAASVSCTPRPSAAEQLDAEILLQALDLVADGLPA